MTIASDIALEIDSIDVTELGALLGAGSKTNLTPSTFPLHEWNMERDDGPIFRFIYETIRPRRHLEFGTWQGWGTALCLDSCDATVWTINLPDGETLSNGQWAYSRRVLDETNAPPGAVRITFGKDELGQQTYHRTDAGGYIGRIYRERGLGHRVCQIYCDSRLWDTSNYAHDFFDSVLIDGGHQTEIVISDTRKALSVLRPNGIVMWHDYCPIEAIQDSMTSVAGVTKGIDFLIPELLPQLKHLFWIKPSWILVGIKK